MAPLTPQEVLDKAREATLELREATREAHEARAGLRDAIKSSRKQIHEAITDEVVAQVTAITDEARAAMREQVGAVIARIEADWRAKLGLDP